MENSDYELSDGIIDNDAFSTSKQNKWCDSMLIQDPVDELSDQISEQEVSSASTLKQFSALPNINRRFMMELVNTTPHYVVQDQ